MMDCNDINEQDAIERYLTDELSEPDRQSFEDHYFGCADCFERLKIARALQRRSVQTRNGFVSTSYFSGRFRATLVPLCVVLAFAISATVYWRGRESRVLRQAAESGATDRTTIDRDAEVRKKETLLAQLAQVEPAPYIRKRLRETGDSASAKFDTAMSRYIRNDYVGAIMGLQKAAALQPDAVDVNFYLGVSYLLTNQPKAATSVLQKAISPEHPDFAEQAHYYLAKAYLQEHNIASAQAELALTLEARGEREKDARRLKHELDNLP